MHRLIASLLLSVSVLVACAAPSPQDVETDVSATTPASQIPVEQKRTPPRPESPIKVPPLGGPLPPERMAPRQAVQVSRSCKVDSDCVVKDIGSCCGYSPACVNSASPTDPAAVQAQCAKDGRASICAFPVIESCRCVGGQCIAVGPTVEPSQDPPASDPVR